MPASSGCWPDIARRNARCRNSRQSRNRNAITAAANLRERARLPIGAAAYMRFGHGATWRSGYATVCKTVYTSSILVVASTNDNNCLHDDRWAAWNSSVGSRQAMPVRRLDHILLAMPAGREADAR